MLSLSPLTGLFVLFAMTCVKAETIMVPGIGSPPASPSVLGGLLGRNIVERQIIRCRDPTATLCLGDFCCAQGSFCQPNNREFGRNCCPDTALNCNGGTACCPSDSVCCSLSESPSGCCIFTNGGGSRPPPVTTRRTTVKPPPTTTHIVAPPRTTSKTIEVPTTSETTLTESRIETDTDFPTFSFSSPTTSGSPTPSLLNTPGALSQFNTIKGFPSTFSSLPSVPTGFSSGNSARGLKDNSGIMLSVVVAMNILWAIVALS